MIHTMDIPETFRNGTVLVTGSTGFLGKLLTEKLLRSCPVKMIAVIVRSKKGFNALQRVEDIYQQDIFDRLRETKPDFMNHIRVIDGNLEESTMGLTSTDREWIKENVNFVFHCAATIKFNEPLEMATKINIQGTENLLELASEMKNIKGFVHVSTAYSHCPRNEIREQYYSVPITAKELQNIFCQQESREMTSQIFENWPNTYSFTKAITENLISKNENHLPISVFRPSIIGCTHSEPEPGWLENMNGPSGILTGFMIGFLRTVPAIESKITDIVPADYTVNALISVMWDTVNRYQNTNIADKEPKIYNYVSSVESPITWAGYVREMKIHYYEAPPLQSMWYIFYVLYSNLWVGIILRFLFHRIPAMFIDFCYILCGKNHKMLKMYAKTEKTMDLLYKFTTREWKFDNSNTREMWSLLNKEDRNMFRFSFEEFDWKPYIKSYYYGIRKHILHEDLNNVARARAKNQKLFWLHQFTVVLVIFFVFKICCMFSKYVF